MMAVRPGQLAVFDPNLPDTVLLCVQSNLNTRLAMVSSRTGTMGDVRVTIKQHHEILFPDRGEVNVTAIEIDFGRGRYRCADPLRLEALFYNMPQEILYVELTSARPNIRPPELPTELVRVPDPDGLLTPSPPATHEQEDDRDTSERGLNQDIGLSNVPAGAPNSSSPVSDYGSRELHRNDRNSEVMKRQVTKKKRNVEEREYVSIVCNRQTAKGALGGTMKSWVDSGHSDTKMVHEEPREVTTKRTEEDSVNENLLVVKSRHKSSNTDGSEKSHHPVKETVQQELTSKPPEKGTAPKTVIVVEPRHNSSSADNSSDRKSKKVQQGPGMVTLKSTDRVSISKSPLVVESKHKSGSIDGLLGLSGKEKAREEVGMVTSNPGSSNRDGSSRPSEPQTDLQHRRIAPEKEYSAVGASMPATTSASDAELELAVGVKRGSLQDTNKRHKRPETHQSSTTSGSTTCESSGQSEGSREKSMDLQGKQKQANSKGGEIVHNNPRDGSKPLSPQGTSSEENCDHEKSENISPLQSSDESEDEDQGSSSEETDGSEEMQEGVSLRRMDLSTPDDTAGAQNGHSRRSFGHFENLKYQHLLDSQDGFDELISLSQQKLKVVPGHQQDHQQLGGGDLLDSVAPVSLEDDRFSIDLVPDTQVGDANKNVGSQGVQNNLTAVDPVEDKIKERKPLTVASASAADPQKECMLPTEPVQDGVEDDDDLQSKSQPLSLGTTGAGLVNSSLTKSKKGRKQGTPRSEGCGLITSQESIVDITVEKDELLLGDSVFPQRSSDAPAIDKGGRSSSLKYRDACTTHDQTDLATTHKTIGMKLGLKGQKLVKSSRKEDNEGGVCAGEDDPLVTEFDNTQKSKEILSEHEAVKTKTRKRKGRLSVLEFTEKSSTLKQSSKKAEDLTKCHKKANSTIRPGPDKSPLEVPDMGEEEMGGKGLLCLDEKHRNADVDKGANMKSANVVVLDEKKKSRGSGEASNAVNKVKNRNRSKLEVAEEMKQFNRPMALGTGHEHSILRNEGETPDESILKKKQKKRKGVELKSSPKVGERRGAEVQSIASAGYVRQEDRATLPQSLDHVRKLNVTNGTGREVKRPRK